MNIHELNHDVDLIIGDTSIGGMFCYLLGMYYKKNGYDPDDIQGTRLHFDEMIKSVIKELKAYQNMLARLDNDGITDLEWDENQDQEVKG